MDRETAREMVRDRADIKRETARYPNTELDRYINVSNRKLHSILVRYGLVRDEALHTITASGLSSYPLPADHFKTLAVWHHAGGGQPRRLRRHTFMDRPHEGTQALTGPAGTYRVARSAGARTIELSPRPSSGTYYVGYVATIADLAADDDELCSTLGYDDEFVIIDAAIKCLRKEGSNTKDLERDLAILVEQIIEDAQSQEEGEFFTVRDVRGRDGLWEQLWGDYRSTLEGEY